MKPKKDKQMLKGYYIIRIQKDKFKQLHKAEDLLDKQLKFLLLEHQNLQSFSAQPFKNYKNHNLLN